MNSSYAYNENYLNNQSTSHLTRYLDKNKNEIKNTLIKNV
jgi:hypothetical protein